MPAQKGCLFLIHKAVLYVLEAAQGVKPNFYNFKSSTLHLSLGELPLNLLTIPLLCKKPKILQSFDFFTYMIALKSYNTELFHTLGIPEGI